MVTGFFKIEMVIRDYQSDGTLEEVLKGAYSGIEVIQKFHDKIILNVEPEWDGFKNGLFDSFLRTYNDSIYVAIAYFANGGEIVIDFDGMPVNPFNVVVNGKKHLKYVKKKMKIITVLDAGKGAFEAVGYSTDTSLVPPMERVLDLYVAGPESGFTLSSLIDTGANDEVGNR